MLQPPPVVRRVAELREVARSAVDQRQVRAVGARMGDRGADFARAVVCGRTVLAIRSVRERRSVRMPVVPTGRRRAIRGRSGDSLGQRDRALGSNGRRGANDYFVRLVRAGRGLRSRGRNVPCRAERVVRMRVVRAERVVRVRVVSFVRRAAGRGRTEQSRGSSDFFANVVLRRITRDRLVRDGSNSTPAYPRS